MARLSSSVSSSRSRPRPTSSVVTPVATRTIAYEPSNSWLKRHDAEGTIVVQAAWASVGRTRIPQKEGNVIVETKDYRRVYGPQALSVSGYTTPDLSDKSKTARETFTACLRPSDDGQRLSVVISHWDEVKGHEIVDSLLGSYEATINGRPVSCEVINVRFILEGTGTYHQLLACGEIEAGPTLLCELGHGTSEIWVLRDGQTPLGSANEDLGVRKVVNEIGSHPQLLALTGTRSRGFSQALLVASLRSGQSPSGRLSQEVWESILFPAVDTYWERVKNYVLNHYADDLQSVSNVVFCGGGAELLGDRIGEPFTRPVEAQTSSVRGAYHWALRNV